MGERYCILLDNGASYSDWSVYGYALVSGAAWDALGVCTDEWREYRNAATKELSAKYPEKKWHYPSDVEYVEIFKTFCMAKGLDEVEVGIFDETFNLTDY